MYEIFKNIVKKIEEFDSIVIFGHIHPDGDCFGSQVGLREIIKANWPEKKVYLAGSGFPKMVPTLGTTDKDILTDDIIENSLAFLVDFFEFYRAEDPRVRNGQFYACLDHHTIPDGYILNNITYVDSNYGSAAGLIFDFAQSMHLKCSQIGYTALLSGVVSDTSRYMHLEKDAKSLRIGYELMSKGADAKDIYDVLTRTDLDVIKLKGFVYTHFKTTNDGIIYCVIPHSYIEESKFPIYPGFFVNALGNIEGYPCWCFFMDQGNGIMSVEIRSLNVPVVKVATKHGGGGHNLACGIMTCQYSEEKIATIVKDLGQTLKDAEEAK